MRRFPARLLGYCSIWVAFFCGFVGVQPISADPIEIFSVDPTSITLDRYDGTKATIRVIASPAAGEELPSNAALTASTSPHLVLQRISGPVVNGDTVWIYEVTARPEAADTETIGFRLGYATKERNGVEQQWLVQRTPVAVTIVPEMRASPIEGVTLEIETGDAPFTKGVPLNGYLKITNSKDSAVTVESVEINGPDFLNIESVEAGQVLTASATTSFPIDIRIPKEEQPKAGKWLLVAKVSVSQGAGPARRVAETTTSIKIDIGLTPSPTSEVTLEIKKSVAPVIENAPLTAYIVIKNQSDSPVTIEDLKVDAPDFLKIALPDSLRVVVNANASHEIPFTVEIPVAPPLRILTWFSGRFGIDTDETGEGSTAGTAKPRIGAWLLVAKISLSRNTGNHTETGTLVADTEIEVGVPGVSEVLKIFELPTVLLVPGALVLAIWGMFSGAGNAAGGTAPSWLRWKSSSFWVVSVTISILIFMSQSFWGSTNYLVGFNTLDIAWLWLVCVAGAATAFAVFRIGQWIVRTYSSWRQVRNRRKNGPLKTDGPLEILKKLERFAMPFYLRSFERDLGGQKQTLFPLEFPEKDGAKWVVPKIIVKPTSSDNAVVALLTRISEANDNSERLAELIEAIESGIEAKSGRALIDVFWERGWANAPLTLASDQIANLSSHNSLVDIDV